MQCQVGRNSYYEGQKFVAPKDKCEVCTCQKGFKGEFVKPYCKPINCNIGLNNALEFRKYCAPMYFNNDCCPIGWECGKNSTNCQKVYNDI